MTWLDDLWREPDRSSAHGDACRLDAALVQDTYVLDHEGRP